MSLLAGLTLASDPAAAQSILFDFETEPDDHENPTFVEEYEEQDVYLFQEGESEGDDYTYAEWWEDNAYYPVYAGSGGMRHCILNDGCYGDGGGTVTLSFATYSEEFYYELEVPAVSLWVMNCGFGDEDYDTSAFLTPILSDSVEGDPIEIEVGCEYQQIVLPASDGPYVGLKLWAEASPRLFWDDVELRFGPGYPPDATSIRDVPTPTGSNIVVIDLDHFDQVALEVVESGETDADFCVGPDLRQVTNRRGRESYVPRRLHVSELAGLGTCTGDLPDGGDFDTWEELLAAIDLEIPALYRSYKGTLIETGQVGYWLVVGVVRSTAQYRGPVGILPQAEALIDYTGFTEPACNANISWRNFSLGGAVPGFDEYENVEQDRVIPETVQCNPPASMTRRTTHIFPVRMESNLLSERLHFQAQIAGLSRTITEAAIANPDLLPVLGLAQAALIGAELSFLRGRYATAIQRLEYIALLLQGQDFIPVAANYEGNLIARSLAASFTIWDRFVHDDDYELYELPNGLIVPEGIFVSGD